ncbi:MFS transporter [Nocardioides sp. SR21]|uniref:MFS transporter n=1 Tax=Nocardioides sp. SR21 TaxID=2919501 RepID=UPI001FA9D759|nr:MFS transporter [Nocardioides sp. SR21]
MTEVASSPAGAIGNARAALRETRDSLASVFRNPRLRRIQLALAGSMIGDWAYATAVAVFAYGVGGAKAVGLYYTVRLGLIAVASPMLAIAADRWPRRSVMVVSDVARFVLVALAAACLLLDTDPWPVFVLAGLASLAGAAFRPAQNAWMPKLADSPEELTASNGTSSTLESLSFFIGPSLGALLITATDVPTVFLLNAATFLVSALLVLGIHEREGRPETPISVAASGEDDDEPSGFFGQLFGGFGAVAHDRDILMVGALLCVQTIVAGASAVFMIVMAVDILETGSEGVGYIDSVFGVGAILGGVFAIARARKRRLCWDLLVGVMLWSLPLLLVWLVPSWGTVFAAAVVMGFGNPLVDVNFATLIQRITPDELLGRVFGTLEGACIGTMALGSLMMPFLIDAVGFETSLLVLGLGVAALAIPWIPAALALDRRLGVPPAVPLLESVPMFAPLSPDTIERLARKLVHFEVPAGSTIITEGQVSDRFFIIESGTVAVSHGDRVVRHEEAGDFFGEIGLLRDVPRTATITADSDTVLLALERDDFLAAVTGQDDARMAAESIVTRRIAV